MRQAEAGTPVEEIARRSRVSEATFCRWKKRRAGLGLSDLRRLRQLEEENRRLAADLSLDNMNAIDNGQWIEAGLA